MLSGKLGHFLDKPLEPVAKRIPFSPNAISLTGFFITSLAALAIPYNLAAGGFLILLGGAFDLLDGVVARTNGKSSRFGAFLDSTLDRYSDSFILLGIAWYFFDKGNIALVWFTAGVLVGSLLISYVRARAEGIGIECSIGVIERPERVVLLAAGCITGLLSYVIVILFFLSHITVIQRVVHVYKSARRN